MGRSLGTGSMTCPQSSPHQDLEELGRLETKPIKTTQFAGTLAAQVNWRVHKFYHVHQCPIYTTCQPMFADRFDSLITRGYTECILEAPFI